VLKPDFTTLRFGFAFLGDNKCHRDISTVDQTPELHSLLGNDCNEFR
jgi:hypothetical protein